MAHSQFLDTELAAQAIELARPAIEQALRSTEISGLGVLHVVILDPAAGPQGAGEVLHEHSFGDRARWDVDYAAFAREKAELSWRHRIDSRRLQLLEPHRLARGESRLWGGVHLDGIVVAASGAEPIWDEAFALQVAGYLRSLAWLKSRLMSA